MRLPDRFHSGVLQHISRAEQHGSPVSVHRSRRGQLEALRPFGVSFFIAVQAGKHVLDVACALDGDINRNRGVPDYTRHSEHSPKPVTGHYAALPSERLWDLSIEPIIIAAP